MEENEMLEQTNETENVETETTEEITDEGIELTDTTDTEEEIEENPVEEKEEVKMFTQEEVDKIVKSRLARKEREYQKELSKYKDTDNVLKSVLNVNDGEDVNSKLREAYEKEGVELPSRYEPGLSLREIEAIANVEAEDIIAEGHEAMVEEANRLARKKYENLNDKEKFIFNKLAEMLTYEEDKKELLSLGAKEELLNDKDFNDFRKQFNSSVPIKKVYELYKTSQPKQKVANPGSMRNEKVKQPKTIFTDEEIAKMTDEELEKNWDAIRKYQTSGNH